MRTLRRGVAALLLIAAAVASLASQPTRSTPPSLVISSMVGRDLFGFYCASCHGRTGQGGGPVAPALKTAPPDLTRLALRNGGVFPRARVESMVAGRYARPIPAHGSSEMPVWGPIFKALDPHDAANATRIANIVEYLASLQLEHGAPD